MIVYAAKLNLRLLVIYLIFINAIVHSAVSKVALLLIPQLLLLVKIFDGYPGKSTFHLGLKTMGFVLIFVQNVAHQFPTL